MFHVRVIAPAAEAGHALLVLEAATGATDVVHHPAYARLADTLGRFEALELPWHAEQTHALL